MRCDFCDRIPFVRRLQRSGEQGIFAHGLWSKFWVDARRPEREQLLDANHVRCTNDIKRDCQIVRDEIGRIGIVCVNAADQAGSQKNCIWLRPSQPIFRCLLIG